MTELREDRAWPWLAVGVDGARAAGAHASVRERPDGGCEVSVRGAPSFSVEAAHALASRRIAYGRLECAAAVGCERWHVLPDRPAIVLHRDGAADSAVPLCLTFAAPVEVLLMEPTRLTLRSGDDVLLVACDGPVVWHFEGRGDHCVVDASAAQPLHIAFVACDDVGRPAPGVGAIARDPVLGERMVDAAVGRLRGLGPEMDARRLDVVDAFEWARSRLASVNAPMAADLACTISGLLSLGDFDGALEQLTRATSPTSYIESAGFVLAVARAVSWTGSTGMLLTRSHEVSVALEHLLSVHPGDPGAGLVAAALREGAPLLSGLPGRADLAARVASRAKRTEPSDAHSAALARIGVDAAHGTDIETAAARALTMFEGSHVDGGCTALTYASHEVLRASAEHALAVREAAAICLAVTAGLIGLDPDATRDRVTLRPRIPAAWLPFRVQRLRAGEASLDLAVRVDADCWMLEVEQTAGPVPVQLVLEPWLPFGTYREVRVDGRIADLAARPAEGGWVLPMQLIPDRTRRVEVVLDARAGPP